MDASNSHLEGGVGFHSGKLLAAWLRRVVRGGDKARGVGRLFVRGLGVILLAWLLLLVSSLQMFGRIF